MFGKDEKLHFGVIEQTACRDFLFELLKLWLYFTLFECRSMVNQQGKLLYLVTQDCRIERNDQTLKFIQDLLLLIIGKFIVICGKILFNLSLTIAFWIRQDFLTAFTHSLQAAPYCTDAGSKAPLQHGHRKTKRTATSWWIMRGFHWLVFNIVGELRIEIHLNIRDLEIDGAHISIGEDFLRDTCFGIRKGDQGFLCATKIKWSTIAAHGLL